MKFTNMLGLAVAAALALMAVGGVGSALATNSTSLCKVNQDVCASGNQYLKGTVISGTTGTTHTSPEEWSQLTTKLGTMRCESTITGKTTSTNGTEPAGVGIVGEITGLTWTNCRFGNPTTGEACPVTSVNLPYKSVFTNTATNKGTLTLSAGSGGGNPGFSVVCVGGFLNCTYTTASAVGTAEGGVAGMKYAAGVGYVEFKEIALTGIGTGCPTSKWDGKYLLESPSPIYLQT